MGLLALMAFAVEYVFIWGALSGNPISLQNPESVGDRHLRLKEQRHPIHWRWQGRPYAWSAESSAMGLRESWGKPFLSLSASNSMIDIDRQLREFMSENASVFKGFGENEVSRLQLSFDRTRFSGSLKTITYEQTLMTSEGRLALDGFYITFRFRHDRLMSLSSSLIPHSSEVLLPLLEPALDESEAIHIVLEDAQLRDHQDSLQGSVTQNLKWVLNDQSRPELISVYQIAIERPHFPGHLLFEVNASTGHIEEIRSNLHFGGLAMGDYYERGPGLLVRGALSEATVRSTNGVTLTQNDGLFDWNGEPGRLELQGPRARILGWDSQPVSIAISPSGETLFDSQNHLSDVMAFVHIGRVNEFVRQRFRALPRKSLRASGGMEDFLSVPLTVRTTHSKSLLKSCNAWYDPTERSLNFLAGHKKCHHSAWFSDIIYHEWGHALDDAMGGIHDRVFSEAVGDILSMLMTGDSRIAPGYLKGEPSIRDLKSLRVFPRDRHTNPHIEGLILGGAWYEFFIRMEQRYGRELAREKVADLFIKHLLSVEDYRESYRAALVLDDDDANLENCTPHYCYFNQAFSRRGLAGADARCGLVATSTLPTVSTLSNSVSTSVGGASTMESPACGPTTILDSRS